MKKTYSLPTLFIAIAFAISGVLQTTIAQELQIASVKKITTGIQQYSSPQWSGDGSQIAFSLVNYTGIYTVDANGENQKQLVSDKGAGFKFSWSADNTQILYRGTDFVNNVKQQYVAVVEVKTTNKNVIVGHSRRIAPPTWINETDGHKAIFMSNNGVTTTKKMRYKSGTTLKKSQIAHNITARYKDGEIHIMNGEIVTETISGEHIYDPTVSNNGTMVVYSEKAKIVVYNMVTGIKTTVSNGHKPAWSPNDNMLTFQISTDDGYIYTSSDLYVYDLNSGKTTQLTSTENHFEMAPQWSPKGNQIAFHCEKDGGIYVITLK